jgi:hypothetical protein
MLLPASTQLRPPALLPGATSMMEVSALGMSEMLTA